MQRIGLALLLIGCGPGFEVLDGPVPGVATVSIRGQSKGTGEVTFTAGDEVLVASAARPDDVTIVGLRAGGDYEVEVTVTDDEGNPVGLGPSSYQAAPPPSSGPTFVQRTFDPDRVCDPEGRFLVSWLGSTTGVAIVDRAGNYRWALPSETRRQQINRTRVSRDGTAVHYFYVDQQRTDDLATLVTRPLDGSEPTTTRTLWGHHDFIELPDRETVAWIGYAFEDVGSSDVVGLPEPWGGADPLPSAADVIYETTLGNDGSVQPREVVNLFDDYFPDHPIEYTEPSTFDYGAFLPDWHNLTHGNSLALVDDTYLLMLRWVDSLLGIDRVTGAIWTFGGTYNEFAPVDGQSLDDLFLQAHFSDAWQDTDGLHVLVFDNRPLDVPSKLSEYVLDVENRTFDRVWTYQADDHDRVMGDVLRFNIEGCDNLLVSFSSRGRLVELTRDGDVVWDVATRASSNLARVQYLPSFEDAAAGAYPTEE